MNMIYTILHFVGVNVSISTDSGQKDSLNGHLFSYYT